MRTPEAWLLAADAPGPTEQLIGRIYLWMATDGLEILIWILGAALLIRLIRWSAAKYAARTESRFSSSDLIVQTEDAKYRRALVDVVAWSAIVIVAIIVFIHALSVLGFSLGALTGPTAVIGAALGFGAQRVVMDILAGFFVVAEKQYGYGDMVNLTITGGSEAEGTVEDVTLRVTRLRTSDGEVVTVPNGQILKATNLSKDWARAVVDVPVPADADISRVNDILDRVGRDFYKQPHWHALLLDAPSSLGVIKLELDAITVRIVTRTLPGKQFEVGRALRVSIVRALAQAGITVAPGRDVEAGGGPPATHTENGGGSTDDQVEAGKGPGPSDGKK